MAGKYFLQLDRTTGRYKEVKTPQTTSDTPAAGDIPALGTGGKIHKDLLSAASSSAGSGDVDKVVLLDATGRIDQTMMPVGVVPETGSVTASEALSAGDWVNVYNSSGTFKARKADATTAGKEANGFVLSNVANAATALVYFEGTNTQVTGQTGGPVFLSTTAGLGTATAPSTSGNVIQRIGTAMNATSVSFEPTIPVELA